MYSCWASPTVFECLCISPSLLYRTMYTITAINIHAVIVASVIAQKDCCSVNFLFFILTPYYFPLMVPLITLWIRTAASQIPVDTLNENGFSSRLKIHHRTPAVNAQEIKYWIIRNNNTPRNFCHAFILNPPDCSKYWLDFPTRQLDESQALGILIHQ